MIAKSITIISENITLYLLLVAIFTILFAIQDMGYLQSGGSAGIAVVWLLVARYVHRSALFDRKFFEPNPDGSTDTRFGGFIFKGLLLGFVAIALAIPFMFLAPQPPQGGVSGFAYLAIISAFLISYSLVLAFAGSWLPADVYGQNKGLGAAFKRGMSNFGPVFGLILGIALLGIVVPVVIILAFSSAGLSTAILANGHFNVAGAILVILLQALQCFCVTVTSVILCHYYAAYEDIAAGRVHD